MALVSPAARLFHSMCRFPRSGSCTFGVEFCEELEMSGMHGKYVFGIDRGDYGLQLGSGSVSREVT